jgi:hypothetical protein
LNRLVLAFGSDEIIARVSEMLASSALAPRSCHRSGAEAVRAVRFMGGGTVVCGVKLPDMTAAQLHADLDGMARMLVIGKSVELNMYAAADAFRLALPINRYDLGASVRMLLQLEEMDHRRKSGPTAEDVRLIARAKALLRAKFNMTEPEAHRYLQKRSMDAGMRMAETAAMLLENRPRAD